MSSSFELKKKPSLLVVIVCDVGVNKPNVIRKSEYLLNKQQCVLNNDTHCSLDL